MNDVIHVVIDANKQEHTNTRNNMIGLIMACAYESMYC
jgi:hypothetical protein